MFGVRNVAGDQMTGERKVTAVGVGVERTMMVSSTICKSERGLDAPFQRAPGGRWW